MALTAPRPFVCCNHITRIKFIVMEDNLHHQSFQASIAAFKNAFALAFSQEV